MVNRHVFELSILNEQLLHQKRKHTKLKLRLPNKSLTISLSSLSF